MEIKTYTIQAWDDMQKMACFSSKEYKRKSHVEKMFENMVNSGFYKMVTMREETSFSDCYVEISSPIKNWQLA